jgi:hypothetical protein
MVRAAYKRQGQAFLVLVFASFVRVTGPANGIRAKEENLGNPLPGVDFGRQRRGITDLDGDPASPFRL